jgi:DNA-binding MarR family transcriptional regulator
MPAGTTIQDSGVGGSARAISGAQQEKSSGASPTQASSQQLGTEQVLQLLGAFLAVLVASYLILHGRQEPVLDAATEKLLDNPTRAGIMEELSSADKIPTDISAKLGKSKAAVVEHLAALSEAGLVERIATPGKKFVFYKLTQKGRQILLRRAG